MGNEKTSFLLKDIDKKWWMKVKIEALRHDLTIRDFIITCIEETLERTTKGGD